MEETHWEGQNFSEVVAPQEEEEEDPGCQAQCAWQRPPATRPKTFHVWKNQMLPVQF
jgi:hypothetical protein